MKSLPSPLPFLPQGRRAAGKEEGSKREDFREIETDTDTDTDTDRQLAFIEISIEAGKLLGGKHEACFVLGVAGIEPMQS